MSEIVVATCLGGVLALAGGLVGVFVQNYFNWKRDLHREKIDAYITMSKALNEFSHDQVSEQTRQKVLEELLILTFSHPKGL